MVDALSDDIVADIEAATYGAAVKQGDQKIRYPCGPQENRPQNTIKPEIIDILQFC